MSKRLRLFISHISDEKESAAKLKNVLTRDFLDLFEIFVSSDTESIAAGDEWLSSVAQALRECAVVVILCSPESVRRPWINFEAGAAWMREIPLVPVCHLGLLPRDLPVPLSLRQGVALSDPEGLKRLYKKISELLSCKVPTLDFRSLSQELEVSYSSFLPTKAAQVGIKEDREIRERLRQELISPKRKWRSLERVAIGAAISEDHAADLLRSDPDIRFSKGVTGNIIVGLRSRVGV
ncbi:toll/interleukin-1 receptor domain-containing protein [Tunturibacter psychrotolerans]|uniref:Toll/interleukin-1 receptor domain-containing protein n=1 Tax=Tunturiibacter psychrotolerans TaxID=3069686 RepID=A0AAU7ZPU5_9BACT